MVNYNTTGLSNGLRIIHLPSASDVIYCGIGIKAGSRHEQQGEEGLAHFCEHLSFKGTRRRSAVQVINAIEGVGGELNAFTNKEDTMFYCAISKQHFQRAVDVLLDIVFCSTYPQVEVEKEREVVCDEIESYEDTPSELIFDDFENLLFTGHPLGHNILGTREQVRSYASDDALRFTHRHYRPENAIFFVSGNIDFLQLCQICEGRVGGGEGGRRGKPADAPAGWQRGEAADALAGWQRGEAPLIIRHRGTHQAHVIIGTTAFSADDSRRWSLYLMNNILGGPGLNSRLNLALRERRGLVYSVDSSMVSYSDTGLWTTYFGCDPADVRRCCRLVRTELNRLMDRPLTDRQLQAAKLQLQGQLAIASDNREQFALDFAKNFLHTGKQRDLTDIMRHIDGLTPQDLQQTATTLFADNRLVTLVYQ